MGLKYDGCPQCLNIRYRPYEDEKQFCNNDGHGMLPFNPLCTCGEVIGTYQSYRFTYGTTFRKSFPKFWRGRYYPEPLSSNCSKCGRPTKQTYAIYLKQWEKAHPYDPHFSKGCN